MLWRSDDRGKTFQLVNSDRNLSGRGAYYTRCAASPDNPNEIYFMAASYYTSIDGGVTAKEPAPGAAPNWDHHEMWIDSTNGNRQRLGCGQEGMDRMPGESGEKAGE